MRNSVGWAVESRIRNHSVASLWLIWPGQHLLPIMLVLLDGSPRGQVGVSGGPEAALAKNQKTSPTHAHSLINLTLITRISEHRWGKRGHLRRCKPQHTPPSFHCSPDSGHQGSPHSLSSPRVSRARLWDGRS